MGVEVLKINEPFNYSRLNNLAVKNSQFSKKCSQILFLNNDVDLDINAVAEMSQWLGEPAIGMVGARLHYPDGTLQHGGVQLKMELPAFKMGWGHVDWHSPPEKLGFSKVISVCDAVSAACVLVDRENFLKVGGFDEIWYPIAFSDTDLAMKFRTRLGLISLYTPYAFGTHHESASRGPGLHEEMEASSWLFRNTEFRDLPQKKLRHSIFPEIKNQ
jgi:GT2 family glycosyltransferase